MSDYRPRPTTSRLTRADHWDHFLARIGQNRGGHRVAPGLYSLGAPGADSPVFVSANYTLSFDALRSALAGVDAHILVLDTRGINVWCAAAKGTFGTDELVARLASTGIGGIVSHRKLVLPQLGAAGVAAHEVQARSGFLVEYGPVRAADLPEYLRLGRATAEMRRVRFDLADRLVLAPIEIRVVLLPTAIVAALLLFAAGPLPAAAAIVAAFAGVVGYPALLPWLPTREFTTQGFALGLVVAAPFALAAVASAPGPQGAARALTYLLLMPPVTAYLALNFTGSSTYSSRTGVRREIDAYIRPLAALFVSGVVLGIAVLALALRSGIT